MGLLTREVLTTRPELGYEDVPLPEFGGEIRVLDWDGTAKEDFDYLIAKRGEMETWGDGDNKRGDPRGIRSAAIAVSAVDEHGQRLFNLNGDVDRIAGWPEAAFRRVSDVVIRRNKVGEKAVEDAKKN